jgi:hypothetical protein
MVRLAVAKNHRDQKKCSIELSNQVFNQGFHQDGNPTRWMECLLVVVRPPTHLTTDDGARSAMAKSASLSSSIIDGHARCFALRHHTAAG